MAMFATSSPEAVESQISGLLYGANDPFFRADTDVSLQVQTTLQNMLKVTRDIDQSTSEIVVEIEKCKESVAVKNKMLEEEKERFQKAALVVLGCSMAVVTSKHCGPDIVFQTKEHEWCD